MSPTEFELRAALRDGEDGGGLDPDLVLARAEGFRRQRRTRVLGAASVAAVVAAIGITGTVLVQSGSTQHGAGSSGARSGATAADGAAAPSNAPAKGGGANRSLASVCPEPFPRLTIAVGQVPSSDALFDPAVNSVLICSYGVMPTPTVKPTGSAAAPVAKTVTGAAATSLVDSLNSARTAPPGICPQYRTLDNRNYVLIGMDANGNRSAPVVVTLAANPCQTTVTNGKTIRYEWTPPESVAKVLLGLTPGSLGSEPSPSHS
jgi:hypothetical protein